MGRVAGQNIDSGRPLSFSLLIYLSLSGGREKSADERSEQFQTARTDEEPRECSTVLRGSIPGTLLTHCLQMVSKKCSLSEAAKKQFEDLSLASRTA